MSHFKSYGCVKPGGDGCDGDHKPVPPITFKDLGLPPLEILVMGLTLEQIQILKDYYLMHEGKLP